MTTAARVLDRATLAALVLLFVGGARAGALREPIEDAARRNFAEYLELLRYRNVADVPADIQRNAEFLRQAFERRECGAVEDACGSGHGVAPGKRAISAAAERCQLASSMPRQPPAKPFFTKRSFQSRARSSRDSERAHFQAVP